MTDIWDDGRGATEEIVERFLGGGTTGNDVRAQIVHSWRRCQATGLSPGIAHAPVIEGLDFECGLVRAARPVFEGLGTTIANTPVCMLLGDANGAMVLRNVGEPAMRRAMDEVGAAPGFGFTEAEMGNNAHGSVLAERRTCQITGNEHYAEVLRRFTAVGTPVRDPLSGRLNGVVCVVCPNEWANVEMMTLARRSAAAVEEQLIEMATERERALLETFLRSQGARRTPGSPLRGLCRRDQLALEDSAVSLIAEGRTATREVALSDGRIATLVAQPVTGSAEPAGIAVSVLLPGP
ncbi:GAF domain-containing protein [Acrocarpospora catenulata]|uniref:GAF domain-containing protein n=1 Tax=Acrocarpospora catenulata TaxID=2836182 RepID=UPI001BDA0E09|nr:GAF domain-containing protein [Acrocarpospora catenulata]